MPRATSRLDRSRPTRAWSAGTYVVLVVAVCLADQLAKGIARVHLVAGTPVTLVDGFLALSLVANEGAAFGMLDGHVGAFVVCAAVVLLASLAYVLVCHARSHLEVISLAMVGAGALGNMIDRVSLGHVVDYIQVLFVDFPVFNLADVSITCGFALFLASMLCDLRHERRSPAGGEDRGE